MWIMITLPTYIWLKKLLNLNAADVVIYKACNQVHTFSYGCHEFDFYASLLKVPNLIIIICHRLEPITSCIS